MIVIQTFQEVSADFSQNIALEGTTYTIRLTWNTRIEQWFFDILDSEQTPILLGIGLSINYLMLQDYAIKELPPGDFYLWDSEQNPNTFSLDFTSFGNRYVFLYITKEELNNL